MRAAQAATREGSDRGTPPVSVFPIRRWVERRWVLVGTAVVMFVVVFWLRQADRNAADGVGLLYVVPIALLALESGPWIGGLACALALALVGLSSSVLLHAHLDAIGFATRGVAFVAVAAAAGRFGARMRDAQTRQRLLLESGLRLAHLQTADELRAALAEEAAKLAPSAAVEVELGSVSVGRTEPRIRRGGQHRFPIALRDRPYGTLTVGRRGSLSPEDDATLSILALQAAVAAENRRLLAAERERAAIVTELHDARLRLAERGGQLRGLIEREEAERDHVAHELREQSAQTLAAVLLGLAALERELAADLAAERLGELRSDIGSTLHSLRALAASLRPPLELGLAAALENLADPARTPRFRELKIDLARSPQLDRELETIIYRVAEEALEATGGACCLAVATRATGRELAIAVEGVSRPTASERLALLRARVELVGGTLMATDSALRATIPVGHEASTRSFGRTTTAGPA